MLWYYKLLAHHPHLVLIAVAIISVPSIIVSLTLQKWPDFSDPTLGFEARGTIIGQRLVAWNHLLEETRPSGMLVANPSELHDQRRAALDAIKTKKPKKKVKNTKTNLMEKLKMIKNSTPKNRTMLPDPTDDSYYTDDDNIANSTVGTIETQTNSSEIANNLTTEPDVYGVEVNSTDEDSYNQKVQDGKDQWRDLLNQNPPLVVIDHRNGTFCSNADGAYAHFVFQRVEGKPNASLLELNALLAMCEVEFEIVQTSGYKDLCEMELGAIHCCRPWSLPNFVAHLSNRTSCFDLTEEDVTGTKNLLTECAIYYEDLRLGPDCAIKPCRVPSQCAQHNAVYNIVHYLADTDAIIGRNGTDIDVQLAMLFIPVAKSTKALPLYYELERKTLSHKWVAITAMDMGLKNALFDDYLMRDVWLLLLGGAFIMGCMWLYTKSFIITVMTFVAIVFSLGVAYFVYTLIFEMPFFPFMNLLALVVIVGIGADDAFIYVKVWNCAVADRELSVDPQKGAFPQRDALSNLIAVTMRHAAISMGVTSLTTSVAFYTSFLNSITAVKCFGIFAGTAVICNYLLMITWLPASVSLVDRLTCLSAARLGITRPVQAIFIFTNRIGKLVQSMVMQAIVEWPYVWITLLGTVGIVSGLMVFCWPRLQLPDSPDFKLFDGEHPFELYDSQFRNRFWFERSYKVSENLPIRFVWGVQAIDTGNQLDPSSRGELHLSPALNISSMVAQRWLLDFCKSFRELPYYRPSVGGMLVPNCFIENVISIMERRCVDEMAGIDRSPCCEANAFPYEPHVFDFCMPQILSSIYASNLFTYSVGTAGPKFERDLQINESLKVDEWRPLVLRALVVEFESNHTMTMSYTEIDAFQSSIQTWFDQKIKSAPDGMRNAWFISELSFYDLQATLSEDTLQAIVAAMSVSLLVLIAVTLNILISLYAIVTITFTISTTIAILVLMGWKLNVLECISVSTAIGLTIDFSLHYGNYYRSCPDRARLPSTKYSLARMTGPTLMAAITTGAAGAFMLPSRILAYIQIGKFLVIVMTVSWTYSTFFLMSVLRVMGPENGFGQLRWPTKMRWRRCGVPDRNIAFQRRSAQCNATDQLLSPSHSTVGEVVTPELHELNAITPNSLPKPIGELESMPINFDRALRHSETAPAGSKRVAMRLAYNVDEPKTSLSDNATDELKEDEFEVLSIH